MRPSGPGRPGAERSPRVDEARRACSTSRRSTTGAIEAFRRVLALEPQNLRARFYGASSHLDAGREAEALETLNEVLRSDPKNVDARLQLGFLHSRAKRYDEAVQVLTEAANLDPRRPEIFLYLGMAHYRATRYERAVRAYEEGLALDEANKELRFQLGVTFEKQGRFDQAVAEFRRVITLDPKHAEAYNYVGYMFAEKGVRLDEAERLIQKALELEPNNGYYIDSLGWAYYQQGRYVDAVRELRRAVELTRDKADPVIFDHLGDAYLRAGDEPAALAAWEKSLELDPANDSVRQKVQRARQRLRRSEIVPGPAGRCARRVALALARGPSASLAAQRSSPRLLLPRPSSPVRSRSSPDGWAAEWEAFPGAAGGDGSHGQERSQERARGRGLARGTDARSGSRSPAIFGLPAVVATAGPDEITIYRVLERRAHTARPSPAAVGRWLGVPLPPPNSNPPPGGQRPDACRSGARSRPRARRPRTSCGREDGAQYRLWVDGRRAARPPPAPSGRRRSPGRRLPLELERRPGRGTGRGSDREALLQVRYLAAESGPESRRGVPADPAPRAFQSSRSIDRNPASC